MIVRESARAYVDRAKSLTSAVRYRGIEVTEENRIVADARLASPLYAFSFARDLLSTTTSVVP